MAGLYARGFKTAYNALRAPPATLAYVLLFTRLAGPFWGLAGASPVDPVDVIPASVPESPGARPSDPSPAYARDYCGLGA